MKSFSRTFSNQNFRQQFSWEEEKRGLEPSRSEIWSKLDQKSDPPWSLTPRSSSNSREKISRIEKFRKIWQFSKRFPKKFSNWGHVRSLSRSPGSRTPKIVFDQSAVSSLYFGPVKKQIKKFYIFATQSIYYCVRWLHVRVIPTCWLAEWNFGVIMPENPQKMGEQEENFIQKSK